MMAFNEVTDSKNYLKLVKLQTAIRFKEELKCIERILEQDGDINYKIPTTAMLESHSSNTVGCTILHLQCYKYSDYGEILKLLLDHGADFLIKNPEGQTIVHESIYTNFHNEFKSRWSLSTWNGSLNISVILLAHLRLHIITNPVDSNGLSHFHAACIMGKVKIIEFFLDNGVSIDQSVNMDSPLFPGYTPLHFATKFECVEAIKFLLLHGANVHAQDASNMTPLDLIFLPFAKLKNGIWKDCIRINEEIAINYEIHNAEYHFGLSHLHVLCAFKDSSRLKQHLSKFQNVNCTVNMDSPICPGYTPLHFAAQFNLESLKLLLDKGADITIKDANQNTPLDLCIAEYSIEVVHDVLARSAFKDDTLADGKTKLTDLVFSMRCQDHFSIFLRELGDVDVQIPIDSVLWPGYTPLHLAIVFKLLILEKKCLKNGADVTAKDIRGQTPLQFAFRRGKMQSVKQMLKYHRGTSNPVDEAGLSHLHIACAAHNLVLVEALLRDGADVNCKLVSTFEFRSRGIVLWAGSTPLHVAVVIDAYELVKLLLEHGADPQARDASGLSAVHRLIHKGEFCDVLLWSSELRECVADGCGLSHLHVACYRNHESAVKGCLRDPEVQVNRVIDCKASDKYTRSWLAKFDGRTPLQMLMVTASYGQNFPVLKLLLDHGADILVDNSSHNAPLYEVLSDFNDRYRDCWNLFVAVLRNDEDLCRRVERVSGLTDLHLACYRYDQKWINKLLANGVINVNARIRNDSPFWSGYTPLHVLIKKNLGRIGRANSEPDAVLQLLLDNGADVAASVGGLWNTPLHWAEWWSSAETELKLPDVACDHVSLMLRSIKDFSTNPTNTAGVSHFHIACWCLDDVTVRKFLNHGVDVNLRIDYLYDKFGGYTPLHLTLIREASSPRKMKIIELLLKYGADVHAESYCGNTPLHHAALCYVHVGLPIFTKIFDAGADINAKNVLGASPLEVLLKKGKVSIKKIKYFVRRGCRINDFNGASDEGLVPMIFAAHKGNKQAVKALLLDSLVIDEVDEMGRSALHNIVSVYSPTIDTQDYFELIEELEKLGCDVDHRDNSGQTALHVAARFRNHRAISALLAAGADVNIIDGLGNTAFAYSLLPRTVLDKVDESYFVGFVSDCVISEKAVQSFANHVRKLQLTGLHVTALNERSLQAASEEPSIRSLDECHFRAVLDGIENVRVGSKTLILRDFISKNGRMWKYSQMRRMARKDVVELFDTILNKQNNEVGELRGLVKLQHRNYLARPRLVNAAKIALNTMVNISLPDLCSEFILSFCANWQLRNFIKAAN